VAILTETGVSVRITLINGGHTGRFDRFVFRSAQAKNTGKPIGKDKTHVKNR
jgi:hypothetical protein